MRVVRTEDFKRSFRPPILDSNGDPVTPEEWDEEPDVPDYIAEDSEEVVQKTKELINITPSMFTEFAIRVPDKKSQQRIPFSFSGRRYLRQPYNTPAKRTLFKCGRQVEKSTLLGNKSLAYCAIINSFNVLYVSPTNQQTKTFSQDRLKEPIETSDVMKTWTTSKLSDNVFQKKFINRSQITLRYAYHNADRTRGIPADMIQIDELQDIITDNIAVIEECASHSPYKLFSYSGTPKSLDNAIEYHWVNLSTQNEWVVPCEHHGVPNDPSTWYWNVLLEDNIGPEGLVCSKCRRPIDAMHERATWAAMAPGIREKLEEPFEGFRIPQIMVPWIEWGDILDKQKKSRPYFYNEVLGLSYDSGLRPLTRQDIIDNCWSGLLMTAEALQRIKEQLGQNTPVFAGVDWGTGEQTYSVIALGAYIKEYFTIFYIHRFEGPEEEPDPQLELIENILRAWKVVIAGTDYGGGFDRNDRLQRKFGTQKIMKYQYSTPGQKVKWEEKFRRFLVHRTEVMTDIFNAIKRRNVFRFPDFAQFEDPFSKDFLNIFSEYNEQIRQIQYKKSPDCTDDSFHAVLLCFLASMIKIPRFDVMNPFERVGPPSKSKQYDDSEED
jgi:hypothetical protein